MDKVTNGKGSLTRPEAEPGLYHEGYARIFPEKEKQNETTDSSEGREQETKGTDGTGHSVPDSEPQGGL